MLNKDEQFVHDMTNIMMSMNGKILKLKMIIKDETLVEVEKLENSYSELLNTVEKYRDYLESKDN